MKQIKHCPVCKGELKKIQPKRLYPTVGELFKVREFEQLHPDKCINKMDKPSDIQYIDADGYPVYDDWQELMDVI